MASPFQRLRTTLSQTNVSNYLTSFFSLPGASNITEDRLLPREWIGQPAPSGPKTLKISSYNILRQPCIGFFHFLNCPRIYKTQEYRHLLLLDELDSLQADVFCLQEVTPGYFHGLLLPEMERRGYQGLYYQKPHGEDDGLAIFFKGQRFRLLGLEQVDLNRLTAEACRKAGVDATAFKVLQNTVALFAHLELLGGEGSLEANQKGSSSLIIGNVHIHHDWLRDDLQALQTSLTLQALEAFSRTQGDPPYLLCGDFNIQPTTPAYALLSQGLWEKELWMRGNNVPGVHGARQAYLGDLLKEFYLRPRDDWRSAYATILGKELESTNPASHWSGCLDYIWYPGERVRPTAALGMVERPLLDAFGGCPNQKCPSDHLSLLVQFELI